MLSGRHAQLHRRESAPSPVLVSMSWAARSAAWRAFAAALVMSCWTASNTLNTI